MKIWIALTLPFLAACNLDKSIPNVELIQDMMESPAVKAQEFDAASPNNSGMRLPPENTVPRGFKPYPYATDIEGAIANRNPIAGQMTEEVLAVGQKYYDTQCAVCHGYRGEGGAQLSISEFMPLKPPTLLSEKILSWTDGNVYHVITVGQGVMGPYASHIPEEFRWQVVNYIRHLQKEAKK